MMLYVCWGTWRSKKGHCCGDAYQALTEAGHDPEVIRSGGCFRTDPLFPRRREVKRLTGNYKVPTLVLDDGTIIDGTTDIVDWASAHPS
jgi:glutathione S-transferase